MASITVSADANGNLTLSDNGNSQCQRHEQVTWVQGTGVTSISNFWAKSTVPGGFWQSGPSAIGNNFHGTIGSVADGSLYDYNIQAVLNSGRLSSPPDPKITVSGPASK